MKIYKRGTVEQKRLKNTGLIRLVRGTVNRWIVQVVGPDFSVSLSVSLARMYAGPVVVARRRVFSITGFTVFGVWWVT